MQVSLHTLQVTAQLYGSWLQLSPEQVKGHVNPQSSAGQRVQMPKKENKRFP